MARKKVYSIDVRIYGTLYVKATSAARALTIAKSTKMSCLEVSDAGSDIDISGLQYYDPDLPDVSLSPAMTCFGPDAFAHVERADD